MKLSVYIIASILLCNAFPLGAQVSPSDTKSTQTVRGQITDAESGTPLSSVRVSIQLASSKTLGAISDKSGNFRIKNVPLGRHTLRVSALGFQEQTINEIMVAAGKESIVNLALIEKVLKTADVVVSYDRAAEKINTVNDYATVSSRAFNIEDTKKYAGALGDPSRMAQNFAGVSGANDSRNDIVVRGNSPSGMLWQLEGLNIPNPNHFGALNTTGGPVSILNNNTLDKSDFFSGAFPAQYGNATAGVFDLRMRNGNSDKHEFLGQIGFNGFELGAEGPLGGQEPASYLINYRYSTLGLFKTLGISVGTGGATPNYQDVNFKVYLPLTKDSRLSVFGLAGKSDIAFLGNEADTTDINLYSTANQNTKVNYKTGIAGLSYEQNLGEYTLLKLTIGASATDENFNGDTINAVTRVATPNGEAVFITQKYSAVTQLRHKFDARNSLVFGASIDRTQFELRNKTIKNQIENVLVDIVDHSLLTQTYLQWKHRLSDAVSFIGGVHAQHFSLGKATAIEPRASVQYTSENGHSLSLGYGLHSQGQNVYDYFVETHTASGTEYSNSNMGFTRSHHAVLSYDWNFADNWRLKAEAYYQSLFNVPVSTTNPSFSLLNTGNSFGPTNEINLVNKGTARNYGVELTIERFFNDGFYLLSTASIFDSRYKGTDGIERNTAFNMGYVFNVLGGKEFRVWDNTLSLSLRASSTGGRYLTPLDTMSSRERGTGVYDDARAFSDRQSPYLRVDLKLGYRIEYAGSTMEFSIDFQNISNHRNVFRQSYDAASNRIVTEYQQGFFPVPTFRYTF